MSGVLARATTAVLARAMTIDRRSHGARRLLAAGAAF